MGKWIYLSVRSTFPIGHSKMTLRISELVWHLLIVVVAVELFASSVESDNISKKNGKEDVHDELVCAQVVRIAEQI